MVCRRGNGREVGRNEEHEGVIVTKFSFNSQLSSFLYNFLFYINREGKLRWSEASRRGSYVPRG